MSPRRASASLARVPPRALARPLAVLSSLALAPAACFEVPSRPLPLLPTDDAALDSTALDTIADLAPADTSADLAPADASADPDAAPTDPIPCFLDQPSGCAPLAELALGADHTCVRTVDGRVFCWGSRSFGQVGDRVVSSEPAPPALVDLGDRPRALTAGRHHTCALTASGAVFCWGRNAGPEPALVPLPTTAASLRANAMTTCALLVDGRVACWGARLDGRSFDPSGANLVYHSEYDLIPTLPGARGVSALRLGGAFACAWTNGLEPRLGASLDGPDALRCWGDGSRGQLGLGDLGDRPTPTQVPLPTPSLLELATGAAHACALSEEGLDCWGDNAEGQLGLSISTREATSPTRTLDAAAVSALGERLGPDTLALGDHTSCLGTELGVHCWGRGQEGLLGPAATSSTRPVRVPDTPPTRHLALGAAHACLITPSHQLLCWGDGRRGALDGVSAPSIDPQPRPVHARPTNQACALPSGEVLPGRPHPEDPCRTCARPLSDLDPAASFRSCDLGCAANRCRRLVPSRAQGAAPQTFVAAAGRFCALLDDASTACFSLGPRGLTRLLPPTPAPSSPPVGLALTDTHLCTLAATGDITCAAFEDPGAPRAPLVPPPSPTLQLVARGARVCALTADDIRCGPPDGPLTPIDLGPLDPPARPTTPGTPTAPTSPIVGAAPGAPWAAIALSLDALCALTPDGLEVHCHAFDGRPLPPLVRISAPLEALTAGDHHFNALTSPGLVGWGLDDRGQVSADADPLTSPAPPLGWELYAPLSLRSFLPRPLRALTAARDFACALSLSGRLACWGLDRPAPELLALTGVTHVAADTDAACAVLDLDRLVCWPEPPRHPREVAP